MNKEETFFESIVGLNECSRCGEFFAEDEMETHTCLRRV